MNLKETVIKQPGEKDMNKWGLWEGEAAERQRELPRGKIPSPDKVRTDRRNVVIWDRVAPKIEHNLLPI